MDYKTLGKRLDKLETIATEVFSLIETTADSCEKNSLLTQEIPLRIACEKQDSLLENLRNTNTELYNL